MASLTGAEIRIQLDGIILREKKRKIKKELYVTCHPLMWYLTLPFGIVNGWAALLILNIMPNMCQSYSASNYSVVFAVIKMKDTNFLFLRNHKLQDWKKEKNMCPRSALISGWSNDKEQGAEKRWDMSEEWVSIVRKWDRMDCRTDRLKFPDRSTDYAMP